MRNLILTLIIWIICFTAIVAGSSLTYKWYRQLGTDIYISFNDVSGLVPNQSKVLYHGVQIGSVNDIDLDPESGKPRIKVRMNKQSMKIIGKDSKFWVVRPEFSLGSVHNLSTISTGDYVDVFPVAGPPAVSFVGLNEMPVEHKFSSGLKITLKATNIAGIEIGTGVLYNELEIGEVGEMSLAADGRTILLTVYIDKPYARVVRKGSIFGNVSGFHADIHIFGGSKITLNSVRTLIRGGIKLITPNINASPAKNGDTFRLLTRDQLVEYEDPDKC